MKNLFLSLLAVICMMPAQAQVIVSGISHMQHPNNVLRYNVVFNTNTDAKAWISYAYVDGTDTVTQVTDITPNTGTSHNVNIIGLKPQTIYSYDVWAFDETGCSQTTGGTFTTDTLPAALPWIDSIWSGNNLNMPGYVMTNGHSNPDKPFVLYNRKGDLIWYDLPENSTTGTSSSRCKFFHWDDEERHIFSSDCHRLMVKKLDGTVLRDIDLSARPDLYLHHDMTYTANGNILAVVSQPRYIDQTSVGGSDSAWVMGQGFIEIDANDNIVMEWHNFEHFDTLNTPTPGGYWLSIFGADMSNWMHGNAIMQDNDGHYILSYKLTHQLVKVNSNTGNVMWRMGGQGGNIDVLPADVYGDQHCINKTAGTDYLVFDNTGMDSLSRVMQFNIDFGYTIPMMYVTWNYTLPQGFFTDILGSGYRTDYGNTMIASGRSRGIFDVDMQGNLDWMVRQSDWTYRAYPVASLYDPVAPLQPNFAAVVCGDDSAFALTSNRDGGQWTGTGVMNNSFDPAMAGIGVHTLVYKYGYASDTLNIEVQDPNNCTANVPDLAFGEQVRVFPVPFSEEFSIQLELSKATKLTIGLTDITGKDLGTLYQGTLSEGKHTLSSGTIHLPNGVYLLQLSDESGNTVYKRIVKD